MEKEDKIISEHKNKRTEAQKEEDRALISSFLVQKMSVRGIADEINRVNAGEGKGYTLSKSQVHYDIKLILEEWRDERKEFIDLVVDRELRTLDRVECEAWASWNRSKERKVSTKIEGGTISDGIILSGDVKEQKIEDSHGDTRYMNIILACMDRRKELLGYAAPKKIEFSGSVGVGVTPMNEEDINRERERILKNMKIV